LTLRIDHTFTPKYTIFGRFINDDISTQEPGGLFTGLPLPEVAETRTNSPGTGIAVRFTMTLAPTLLNELGYAYSYGAILSQPIGLVSTSVSPDIKPNLPFSSPLPRVPDLNFVAGQGIGGFGPFLDYNRNHAIFDNVTKVLGRHTLKAGFAFSHYEKDENQGRGLNGAYSFYGFDPNGQYTFEQEWANFLLGNVANFSQTSAPPSADILQNLIEWFAQDEFRVRSNLTLTYGFRWSFFRQPTDGHGHLSAFDPQSFDHAAVPSIDIKTGMFLPGTVTPITNGVIFGGQNSPYGDAIAQQNNFNIAPRLGLAWDPFGRGRTSIRAGYGIFFDNPQKTMYEAGVFYNPQLVNNLSISNTNLTSPAAAAPDINLLPNWITGIAPNWKQPYSQQWNLDFQQQISGSTVVGIGYCGNRGLHLPGLMDINEPRPGAYLSAGVLPQGPIHSYDTQLLNYVRPYRGYSSVNLLNTGFNSHYNSLQTQLKARIRKNSQLEVAYTWSHAQTDSGGITFGFIPPQNIYNLRAEHGDAAFDRRHVFNANFVYTAPFYGDQRGWTGRLLGGWELAGMFFGESGRPITIGGADIDPAGLGLFGPNLIAPRPDQLGDPNLNAPHSINSWFDTTLFAQPPVNGIEPGTVRPGSVRGPGATRLDFAISKNTRIAERVNLQFRVESTNLLNHTNLDGIGTWLLDTSTFGKVTSARDPRIVQLALKLLF